MSLTEPKALGLQKDLRTMLEITRAQDRYSPDLQIPAAFFLEDMPELDEVSLRAFLLLLAQTQPGGSQVDAEALAQQLQVPLDRLLDSFKVLAARGLLTWTPQGMELADLKLLYRQRVSRKTGTASLSSPSSEDASLAAQAQADLANLVSQINHTFYQGVMPLAFYNSIEKWSLEYGFAADLIYALFNEIKQYGKLQANNYAERVAAAWREEGLRTFADLNARHEANQGLTHYAKILERKLRLTSRLTAYQLDYLQRWLYEWDLPFDLIDEAFRRAASKQAQPNFNYVDAILKNWSDAGLRSLADLADYEANYQAQKQAQMAAQKAAKGRANRTGSQAMGNFDQRQYQEEEITSLYRSLDFLKAEPEAEATSSADAAAPAGRPASLGSSASSPEASPAIFPGAQTATADAAASD